MDAISHILFSSMLYGGIDPLVVIGSLAPDGDEIFVTGIRNRSWFQELPTISFLSSLFFFAGIPQVSFGLVSHFLLDFLSGKTHPLSPFVKEEVDFSIPLKYKIILGGVIWVIGLAFFGRELAGLFSNMFR